MSKKQFKLNPPPGVVNEEPHPPTPYEMAINNLKTKHQEKGTLAFELLKALITSKAPLQYDMSLLSALNNTAFTLADIFKSEMDSRWNNDISEVTNKFKEDQKPAEVAVDPVTLQ